MQLEFGVVVDTGDSVFQRPIPHGARSWMARRARLLAVGRVHRTRSYDGWLAVFFEFWGHVMRHPELRERFAAIHARFLELVTEGVRQLAEDRGLALPADVTASQVALAWNAMEVGLGLERLTQPRAVDQVLARRMGWLLLDAALATTQPPAGKRRPTAGSEDPMNTQLRYQRRRLADVAGALRLARTQTRGEQGPRAQLAHHQQQRLETVVRHAATHSPFYRRRLAETGALGDGPVQLQRLPVLTRDPQVREFQVVQDGPVLRILIVPSHAATAGDDPLESRLGQAVAQQLIGLGAHDPQVTVERRPKLPRSAGGKLVIADPASRPVHTTTR